MMVNSFFISNIGLFLNHKVSGFSGVVKSVSGEFVQCLYSQPGNADFQPISFALTIKIVKLAIGDFPPISPAFHVTGGSGAGGVSCVFAICESYEAWICVVKMNRL